MFKRSILLLILLILSMNLSFANDEAGEQLQSLQDNEFITGFKSATPPKQDGGQVVVTFQIKNYIYKDSNIPLEDRYKKIITDTLRFYEIYSVRNYKTTSGADQLVSFSDVNQEYITIYIYHHVFSSVELSEYNQKFGLLINHLNKKITPHTSDSMKVLRVYDSLRNVLKIGKTNVPGWKESNTYLTALLSPTGETLCNGWASLAQETLTEIGVKSKLVYGYKKDVLGNKEKHAWNIIQINGKWLHFDFMYQSASKTTNMFLFKSDEQFEKLGYEWTENTINSNLQEFSSNRFTMLKKSL